MNIKWKKFNDGAILPSKRDLDAALDIYTIEKDVWLEPHQTRLFSTGLGVCMPSGYWLRAADRGSTGSKGIHVHCGIIDENYTGEIFIALDNTNDYPVHFTAADKVHIEETTYKDEVRKCLIYPVSKAIAQVFPMETYKITTEWISDEDWKAFEEGSDRGAGKLGSSGK